MDASRYARPSGLNPGALALSLGGSVVFLFGLSLTAPNFVKPIETILTIHDVKDPPPPRPLPEPKPQSHRKDMPILPLPKQEQVQVTKPPVDPVPGGNPTHYDGPPTTGETVGTTGGTLPVETHLPVVFGPEVDARYRSAFQPAYPVDERAAEREGRVVVRVLIGTDGRVKAVEQVGAASPAFFEATRRQALAKWRFTPGTRDGVPVEAWRTMAVRFQLDQE